VLISTSVHPLLRIPYAALGAAAEFAVALSRDDGRGLAKWRRALSARRTLPERLRAFSALRDASRPMAWFHAPSVGEALMALPVIQGLRDSVPAAQRALTWYSPSAEAFAARFDVDFRDYLPFDTARGADTALDALRPTALCYSKLDVWPVLTERAARRGVRLGLIAAALRPRSARRGVLARALLRDAYARLEAVGAVTSEDAERLAALGTRRDAIVVTGDTRYDQVWDRVHRIDRSIPPVSSLVSDRPTIVAGSTWPADEGPLLEAWEGVRRRIPAARLILAPHEPTPAHIAPLRAWGIRAGLTTSLESDPLAAAADVIVVDRIGVLGELYALAQGAFVGGGFHRAGLHSVLEPAALGVPVAFGPRWQESRDAAGLLAAGGARSCGDSAELARTLQEWLSGDEARLEAGRAAESFVRAGLGAARRSVRLVTELLR
jgi:3-deoxy-D-manno-octulosonic-acid transferase